MTNPSKFEFSLYSNPSEFEFSLYTDPSEFEFSVHKPLDLKFGFSLGFDHSELIADGLDWQEGRVHVVLDFEDLQMFTLNEVWM